MVNKPAVSGPPGLSKTSGEGWVLTRAPGPSPCHLPCAETLSPDSGNGTLISFSISSHYILSWVHSLKTLLVWRGIYYDGWTSLGWPSASASLVSAEISAQVWDTLNVSESSKLHLFSSLLRYSWTASPAPKGQLLLRGVTKSVSAALARVSSTWSTCHPFLRNC